MREGAKRLVTPQERLLLHTVYKAMGSFVENKFTDDEKQKVFEAALDIPDERLIFFRDRHKLIRTKHSVAEGKLKEWDVEAVAWRDNVFNIISQVWPILKDIKEFHE